MIVLSPINDFIGNRLNTDGMVQNGTGVLYEMVWSVLDAQFYRIPVFPTLPLDFNILLSPHGKTRDFGHIHSVYQTQ
jgi:hypothetical protein